MLSEMFSDYYFQIRLHKGFIAEQTRWMFKWEKPKINGIILALNTVGNQEKHFILVFIIFEIILLKYIVLLWN